MRKSLSVLLAAAAVPVLSAVAAAPEGAMPFTAPGSYFVLSRHGANERGPAHEPGIWLRSVSTAIGNGYVCRFAPMDGDRELPVTAVRSTPGLYTVETAGGSVEMCLSDDDTLLVRSSSPTLGLKLSFCGGSRWHYAWEVPSSAGRTVTLCNLFVTNCRLVLDVLSGEKKVESEWGRQSTGKVSAYVRPAADGIRLSLRDCRSEWDGRLPAFDFDRAVEARMSDFASFLERMPKGPERYCATRYEAARVLWGCQVEPRGHLRRRVMVMSKNWMCRVWSWDHAFTAMAMAYGDPDVAWDQFMSVFDFQTPMGQLPDSICDGQVTYAFVKPPIHGWALRRLIRTMDLPQKRLDEAYEKVSAWTNWWLEHRDRNGNGLCEYDHGNDSGWDNSTAFDVRPSVETPELAAYLVVQMRTLADLAARTGRAKAADEWNARATAMADRANRTLFAADGTPLVRQAMDGTTTRPDTMMTRLAMLMGDDLDPKVRRHLADEVVSAKFLTEWGLATESPKSAAFNASGYWRGPIWAPETLIAVDGLRACGRGKEAREIAERFCRLCEQSGFAENFNPLTGDPLCDKAYGWTAATFLILSHELGED